jgi:hypothetical protein
VLILSILWWAYSHKKVKECEKREKQHQAPAPAL